MKMVDGLCQHKDLHVIEDHDNHYVVFVSYLKAKLETIFQKKCLV